jgi:hypothetical protein
VLASLVPKAGGEKFGRALRGKGVESTAFILKRGLETCSIEVNAERVVSI